MLKWKALAWNVANQVKDNSARQGSRPRLNESGDGCNDSLVTGGRRKLRLEPGILPDYARCSEAFCLNFSSGDTSMRAGFQKREQPQKVLVY